MTEFRNTLKSKVDINIFIENYALFSKGYKKLYSYSDWNISSKAIDLYLHCRNLLIQYCEKCVEDKTISVEEMFIKVGNICATNFNGMFGHFMDVFRYVLYNIKNKDLFENDKHYIYGLIDALKFA